MKDKCIIILEYGIPNYRSFIFDWFKRRFKKFVIIHSGERFNHKNNYKAHKGLNLRLFNDISLCFFNVMKVKNFDFVISTLNFRKPHTWLPWFIFRKKKWIFWGQGPGKSTNGVIGSLKKYIISNSHGYVVYTPEGKKELENFGIESTKISIAYNTLKIENSEMTYGKDYLLYVGRIQDRKGLDKVLYALKNTSIKFVVVGEGGDYESEFKNLVLSLGLSKQVIFKGGIYEDQKLKSLFSNSIAYISPDHVGLGVVHAFAYGVPVIVGMNNDHAPEFSYCSKENSYIYEKDDDLSDVIYEVFENEKIRMEKKKNALKMYKEKLDPDNVLSAFDYHFNKA